MQTPYLKEKWSLVYWKSYLRIVWSFFYVGGKVDTNGLGTLYLVKHYILLWGVVSLLLHYSLMGFYAFLVPIQNNKQFPVVFFSDAIVVFQAINHHAIIAAIALIGGSIFFLLFNEWTILDEKKPTLDKIFLIK